MSNTELARYMDLISRINPENSAMEVMILFRQIYEDGYRKGIRHGIDMFTNKEN